MFQCFTRQLEQVGLFWFAVIVVVASINGFFLIEVLEFLWLPDTPFLVSEEGERRAADFITFWLSAKLAAGGEALVAYDIEELTASLYRLTGRETRAILFLYPPHNLLLTLPIGLLPYPFALFLWQCVPLAGLFLVLRRLGVPLPLLCLLPLSGGVVENLFYGQNGMISTLFLAGGLLCLERRPWLAGLCFALFTYKPQLALLVGPTLLAGRKWRALAAMVIGFSVLVGASLLAFGSEVWFAFVDNSLYLTSFLERGHRSWSAIPAIFVAADRLGATSTVSWTLQGAAALLAFAAVVWAWTRSGPMAPKVILLIAAIPLSSPWVHDYDLVMLFLPMAWLLQDAGRAPLRQSEIGAMVLVWALPAWWMNPLAEGIGVSPGVLFIVAFFLVVLRRVADFLRSGEKGSSAQPSPSSANDP